MSGAQCLITNKSAHVNETTQRGMDVDPETQLLCDKAFQGGDIQSFKQHISQLTLAQLNGKNGRGQTALLCASRQGHLEFVRALVQADGIDVNLGDSNVTPLHGKPFCCRSSHF